MEALIVTVAIPPRSLSPNARVHYRRKAEDFKKTKIHTGEQTQIAMHEHNVKGGWMYADCRVFWYARCARRRDRDNLNATLKAVFDGLVVGGLLIDDDNLTHLPMRVEVDARNPRVELHLRETDGSETPII